jgi:lysophospholipid acyltransferase (LPLAT)-like uncharacterized protein
MRSLRCDVINDGGLNKLMSGREPFVLVFWHGSMMWPWWKMRSGNAAALVSRSKDGQMLADLLTGWKYNVVRGSSHRGGGDAMSGMRALVRAGHVLCVTPDGPRGPRHEMKMGAVRVAQTTGVPLVLCSVSYTRKKCLASWDAFEIPFPFTRARIEFSDVMMIDPELEGEGLDEVLKEIEGKLKRMSGWMG